MQLNNTFIKTYTNKTYKYVTIINHRGTLIAFAMDNERHIYYAVLDLADTDNKSPLDVNYWPENPVELEFTNEIVQVGYSIFQPVAIPVVKKDSGGKAATPEENLSREEMDIFLSSTARLTANAPFQTLSDNQYVYIFRQSIDKNHEDLKTDGNIVVEGINSNLLVDRFVMVGTKLERKREVRYKRNRHKTEPQGKKDSLGAVDMNKQPFYEPTQQLKVVGQLQAGHFTVLLLPTQLADVKRWQIFTHNSETKRIDSFNIERSQDGLFNTKGTQFYTSPDPEHQDEVFERKKGDDPFTKKPLIPILSQAGYAGSALAFDGGHSVELDNSIDLESSDFTVEAWVKIEQGKALHTVLGIGDDPTGVLLGIHNLKPCMQWGGTSLEGKIPLAEGVWYHIAWQYTLSSQAAIIFVNGVVDVTKSLSTVQTTGTTKIGMLGDENGFEGQIDELRVWNTARSEVQIQADRHHRLVGDEAELTGYWRFDEKQGDMAGEYVYDLSDNNNTGTIDGAEMVVSDAPIGDHPGIRRARFSLDGHTVAAGVTALLYYQQEKISAGHNLQEGSLKQNARVMLAMATERQGIAVLDFAVSREGKLAQAPVHLKLSTLQADDNKARMPLLHTDPFGLTMAGGVLDFAAAQDTPYLFDSATAQLALYFREQTTHQFRAAYFDTHTAKVKLQLATAKTGTDTVGKLNFIARSADSEMDNLKITVKDDDGSSNSEFCQVIISNNDADEATLDSDTITETWKRVPREVQQFAVVLNGSIKPEFIGPLNADVSHGNTQLTLASRVANRAFAQGDVLVVGRKTRVKIAKQILDRKTKELTIDEVTVKADKGTSVHLQKLAGKIEDEFSVKADNIIRNNNTDRALKADDILWINSNTKVVVKYEYTAEKEAAVYLDNGGKKGSEIGKLTGDWSIRDAELSLNIERKHTFKENDKLWVGEKDDVIVIVKNQMEVTGGVKIPLVPEKTTFKTADIPIDPDATLIRQDKGTAVCLDDSSMKKGDPIGQLSESWSSKHPALILMSDQQHAIENGQTLWVGDDVTVKVNKAITVKPNSRIEILLNDDIIFKSSGQSIYLPEKFLGQLGADWESSSSPSQLTLNEKINTSLVKDDRLRVGRYIEMTVDSPVATGATIQVRDAAIKSAAPVSFIPYDYQNNATINRTGGSLQNGSLLLKAVPDKVKKKKNNKNTVEEGVKKETVSNGSVHGKGETAFCHWKTTTSSGNALSFANKHFGKGQENVENFDAPQGDITLEAWIRPSYNHGKLARLISHVNESKYTLGLQHQEHESALQLKNTTVEIKHNQDIDFDNTEDFTVETWVCIDSPNAKEKINIIGKWNENGADTKYPYALAYSSQKIHAYRKGVSGEIVSLTSKTGFDDKKFHHIAFVKKGNKHFLYVDGNKEGETNNNPTGTNNKSLLYFGSQNGSIAIDEPRIWNIARTEQDINNGIGRYLKANEPGLVGYWYFKEGSTTVVKNRTTYTDLNGTCDGTMELVNSPIPKYTFFAYIGEQFKQSSQPITGTGWEHLAAVYNQSYGLKFTADNYLECDHNSALNLQDLTIEVILQLDTMEGRQPILSKGTLNSGDTEQNLPYALYIEGDGNKIVFVFEDDSGNDYTYTVDNAPLVAADDSVHKITVTRKKCTEPARASGDDLVPATNSSKKPDLDLPKGKDKWDWGTIDSKDDDIKKSQNADYLASKKRGKELKELQSNSDTPSTNNSSTISGTQVNQWTEIKMYLDGEEIFNKSTGPLNPGYNTRNLEIGKFGDDYFCGTICEVRLWSQALEQSDINQNQNGLNGREQGLIAWWRLEENEGQIAYDSKGENHASIKGAKWVKNPDPQSSPLVLYRNGVSVGVLKDSNSIKTAKDKAKFDSSPQFTLGARQKDSSTNTDTEYFRGKIDEVRIWKTARTQEQLQDNLFSRLKGEKASLIANYTFDEKDEKDEKVETKLKDHSLAGNHLSWNGDLSKDLVPSTAPISDDTALVHPVGTVDTQFHGTIGSRPTVEQYADTQTAEDGDMTGVMKRCYAYIKDDQWHLLSGFKVGNLITEWISQVQFNPQVMGYIEGAPPVPSENLTAGPLQPSKGDYSGGAYSEVEMVEAESIEYNFSVSKERGIDTSFEAEAKIGGAFDTRILIAPLGLGTSFKLKGKFTGDFKGNLDASNSWVNEESGGAGRNTTKSTTVGLAGNWEDEKLPLNSSLGRRYQPANLGFALVQSETADVFALRLAHNRALVAFRFLPNPDIPKDVNLIPFLINPRYTKQGTLDGAVGYSPQGKVCDPDYPNAQGYGEYSYYKPTEAYALKQRIQREEQELKTYYENFDTSPPNSKIEKAAGIGAAIGGGRAGPVGAGIGAAIGAWGEATFGGLGEALSDDKTLPEKFAKRNFVNTYVWSADGGLYEESIEFTEVKQETTSTSYSFSGMAGAGLSVELEAPIVFEFSMNAMMGGHLNTTKSKSRESQSSFSINVTVDPPGDLQQYKKDGDTYKRVYDAYGNPVTVEGKVDGYRFMTFYLEPSKENFDDLFNKIIDPIWLSQSGHHNAIALQQAKVAEKKPPCWRVMHRVTFVSRILPAFPDPTAASMEKAMQVENIESNWELIRKLEPFVRDKTDSFPAFSDAVRQTLETYLPELVPYDEAIIKYVGAYFGVAEIE